MEIIKELSFKVYNIRNAINFYSLLMIIFTFLPITIVFFGWTFRLIVNIYLYFTFVKFCFRIRFSYGKAIRFQFKLV
jgi:hypothetical protein